MSSSPFNRRAFLRWTAAFTGSGLAVGLLAACASPAAEPPATAAPVKAAAPAATTASNAAAPTVTTASKSVATVAPQAAAEAVTLNYWTWFGQSSQEGQQNMLDTFAKAFPSIKLEYLGLPYGDFLDKVTISYAGGTPPDLIYMDNKQQGFFGKKKLVVDQAPLAKGDADFHAEKINPKALDLFTYKGLVLGYPVELTTGQVFYNEDVIKSAGLPTPAELYAQDKWTWDALRSHAAKLTKRDSSGRVEIFGFNHGGPIQSAIWSNGGDQFDSITVPTKDLYGEPEAIDALQFLADLINKDKSAASTGGLQSGLGLGSSEAFLAGKIAMLNYWGIGHGWDKFKWSVVPFPKGTSPKAKYAADLTTECISIMNKTKFTEQSWSFARWYQKDWQKIAVGLKENARVPSRSDLDDIARKALPAPADIWFDLVKVSAGRPVFPDWPKIESQMVNPAYDEIFSGRSDAKTTMTKLAKDINDFLAANPQ